MQIDRQAEAEAQRQPRGQGGGGKGEGAEGRRQGQKQGAGATAEADRAEAEAEATKASLGACAGNCRKEKKLSLPTPNLKVVHAFAVDSKWHAGRTSAARASNYSRAY